MQTIHETIKELHAALTEYIEATYHISAPTLLTQRQELLARQEVIHQIPYLESTPRYETGMRFEHMDGLSDAALEVYTILSRADGSLPRLLYDPPYKHQSESIANTLIHKKNLVIMTGTGSGKTESFLLPILGNLAREAKESPESFSLQSGMRALILYPMNALVNDQLGRLRSLFGDPRLVDLFKSWSGRPPRFARYTSRTPYAGVREAGKDSRKLIGFNHFYVELLNRAKHGIEKERVEAQRLINQLKNRGKWPAKPDLAEWYGQKGTRWKDAKTGKYIRAVTLPDDAELVTRHEVQSAPPDLLVTNYSMLEYMLMRPIERPVFDKTRDWLAANPEERFLLVLDEAHLYRGAAGAEVGLLLRRLRDRLDISPERFQVICATASFQDDKYAPEFGAQLSGVAAETFVPIIGNLDFRCHAATASLRDAEVLSAIDLSHYYAADTEEERFAVVQPLLEYRQVKRTNSVESSLYTALEGYGPMALLVNTTMKQARPIDELSTEIFPDVENKQADAALTVLMALGSISRMEPDAPGLLPCRIHNFFRGLPGLWVCMDPDCTELSEQHRDGICGKMYSQPVEFCDCGARVLEFFTCRNCGTAYARAYTDDIDTPTMLWSEPGKQLRFAEHETSPLFPLDLLLEEPSSGETAEIADYDLETGRLNPNIPGSRMRSVYLRGNRIMDVSGNADEDEDFDGDLATRGQFVPCAVCGKTARFGRSYVQDHQTKGDEPFQALLSRQILIQPPAPVQASQFAPLRGRKVLTFSDSRQVAARLAPNLQNYSVRDSLRPLILYGFKRLQATAPLQSILSLEDLYLAVLLASQELGVRLRPELKGNENFYGALEKVQTALAEPAAVDKLLTLCIDIRNETAPEALLENMLRTMLDRFLGVEALALATIIERPTHGPVIEGLPNIQGIAETGQTKRELTRAWLRCWTSSGFWLKSMPLVWANRPRSEGMSIQARKGKFKTMEKVLRDRAARRVFDREWLPVLLQLFTQPPDSDQKRLRGSELSLLLDSEWVRCLDCKSVHRPITGISHCLDCGSDDVVSLNPDTDPVFLARKGYYRRPAVAALATPPKQPMALIAAEHTAQLNAPQSEDIFSKAEENELLFQDVELVWGAQGRKATAIDVLSSTTTMEVGIDLGALSGVALRNMPPARANYQQRAGRAGRRGNAIATVIAFGSADSHDEHYFSKPDGMICGAVIDPKLTLDNKDIVRRHIRAFLLQNYHQARLTEIDETQRHDLFSVLGTVSDFRSGEGVLNRDDFGVWLEENEGNLRDRVATWIPDALSPDDRTDLLTGLKEDCLNAIDDAIGVVSEIQQGRNGEDESIEDKPEDRPEVGDEEQKLNISTLLDRLLYCGKLPRYAFPTDVAAFSVFDRDKSTPFRPVMRFAPQQGLPVALSQYAPGKQVWIAGKCYTSGAIYSVMSDERFNAWSERRRYLECTRCGFAKTEKIEKVDQGDVLDCPACLSQGTFGPARNWMRPPGFAHPIDLDEVTSPDEIPETSYATRAKLTMESPLDNQGWLPVNDRVRVFSLRQHLLVSNTGPQKKGYSYCTKCGRIEADTVPQPLLIGPHRKPFPARDTEEVCEGGGLTRHLVLGTDFITDIALFSMRVEPPIRLTPGYYTTDVALRTLSEALAKAACRMLEIEPGELMAEYRPALTQPGAEGLEAEIFLYDTLPGGAGFASQLPERGAELFHLALDLVRTCPEDCDASCYRCLRSFKNKFEHALLDRHIGTELLEYLVSGSLPTFEKRRLSNSVALLSDDIKRNSDNLTIQEYVDIDVPGTGTYTAPIHISRADGMEFAVIVSGPLEIDYPSDPVINAAIEQMHPCRIIPLSELSIRGNLADATSEVLSILERAE
ncbi:MAG: DUF1998 domain-containing protein [Candidatus Thiodiazotropha sp. (ex Codakia orbicularis)]|nr:DUF1998 domain-containing protein [Candidatus Thiodiazotropha sp. (ex Codakia orbicularis)]